MTSTAYIAVDLRKAGSKVDGERQRGGLWGQVPPIICHSGIMTRVLVSRRRSWDRG